jgi:PAS domain S-box-containing protein
MDTLRESGIQVVGAVPWGTHFCQFYQTSQDLVETLVPYFREGLAAREFCMWVTSPPLQVEEAKAALRAAVPDLNDYTARGQIEILDYRDWYTKSGEFRADEVLQGWVDKHDDALRRGYEGLRLSGNTFWLEQTSWDDFAHYEETINNVIGRYRMLAICTYCLEKCGAREIAEVVATHQFALIKRLGRWQIVESSRHRLTETALRESEERLRTLSDATFEGIAIHHRGMILEANQAFAAMFGYHLSEVIGMHTLDFVAPESRDVVRGNIRSRYRGRYEFTGLRKDKTTFPVEACGRAVPYRGGMARVAALRDITEHKRAEEALQKAREELENRVERQMERGNPYGLTFRELTVLHLVGAGKADKEIASQLGISTLTASKHLANILNKMGAASRTEACVRAMREGLLD